MFESKLFLASRMKNSMKNLMRFYNTLIINEENIYLTETYNRFK